MKILISGATGFIGKNLTNSLVNEHDIFALVRPQSNLDVLPKNVKIFNYTKNNRKLISFVNSNKIEGIIHLAASVIVDHKIEDIDTLIDSNIRLGTNLLECTAKSDIEWFINTGTFWQHYKNQDYNPVNLYAATKQAFEDILKYYVETMDKKFVTIKLNDTFGPNDSRLKIFHLWAKIAKSGKTLKMSPGEQIIDFNHIDNVIAAYKRIIEILKSGDIDINGMSFALYSDNRLTLKELAKLYQKITDKKLNIEWEGREYREREVMKPWDKGEPIPGFEPVVSLEEGILEV